MAVALPTNLLERLGRAEIEDTAQSGGHRTLPGAAYTDPDVFAWEMDMLWANSWVCVGREEEWTEVGTQRAVQAGSAAVVVVRSAEGLRAFHNTCRHRGHELVTPGEPVCRALVVCPYHQWSYDLEGALRGTGRGTRPEGFEAESWALGTVAVDVWDGWVFVDAGGGAGALSTHVGDLAPRLSRYGSADLRSVKRITYNVTANWKVLAANYHECYHCASVHPELLAVCDVDADVSEPAGPGDWIGGPMPLRNSSTLSMTGEPAGRPLDGLDELDRGQVWLGQLLPNLMIAAHPDYVLMHRFEPEAPDRTVVHCDWLQAVRDDNTPEGAIEVWDLVNRQDWKIVEAVQRGVTSPGYRPGPTMEEEASVRRYEAAIANAYLTGTIST